jgi:hypothetical protein
LEYDDIDSETLYGKCLLINNLNRCIPFFRGHFLIIPKTIAEVITKYDSQGEDDIAIGTILYCHYRQDYLSKHIKEIDGVEKLKEDITYKDIQNSFFIRVKDEDNALNNIQQLCKIHEMYKELDVKSNVSRPHNFTHIETPYGCIPIE